MTPDEIAELLPYLTAHERDEINAMLAADTAVWHALPSSPQSLAYYSPADIIGYGGAAGGGKTDLVCGLATTYHHRSVIFRREKAQTEGIVQRLQEILGHSNGYNSQKSIWRVDSDRLIEFGGLANPGDESRWQGRPHDLKAYDEVTEMREAQVRFTMGWNRTSQEGVHCRVLMTFNPPTTAEGRWVIDFFAPWLDPGFPKPAQPGELRYAAMLPDENGRMRDVWLEDGRPFVLVNGERLYDFDSAQHRREDIIEPKSRTFIPARVTDNPYYVDTGYIATLQALPEPLRSQMLYGDFLAGVEDDPWQVCPTAWVDAAMARWREPDRRTEMLGMGVDVARGGQDETVIARRHAPNWYDKPIAHPGKATPDGPAVAGQVIAARRDTCPVHIDVIGVGASPYDFLKDTVQVVPVDVRESSTAHDRSGQLDFANLRSQLIWQYRELLDPANNTGIALPPHPRLRTELCAFTWSFRGRTIYVISREEMVTLTGHSPDYATAYILASIETPNAAKLKAALGPQTRRHDPLAEAERSLVRGNSDYDPLDAMN